MKEIGHCKLLKSPPPECFGQDSPDVFALEFTSRGTTSRLESTFPGFGLTVKVT